MRYYTLTILSLLFLLSSCNKDEHYDRVEFELDGEWERLKDFPDEPPYNSLTLTCNGKGYLFGGIGHTSDFIFGAWEYDPLVDEWTKLLDTLPCKANVHLSGFAIEDKIYFGLGKTSSWGEISNEFWVFDTNTRIWEQLSDFPFDRNFTSLNARDLGFTLDNKGYISYLTADSISADSINPFITIDGGVAQYIVESDTWIKIRDTPISPFSRKLNVFDNKLYLITNIVSCYNPISSEFDIIISEPKRNMRNPFILNENIYYMERSEREDVEYIWEVSISNNTTRRVENFPSCIRSFGSIFNFRDYIVYVGGDINSDCVFYRSDLSIQQNAYDIWKFTID